MSLRISGLRIRPKLDSLSLGGMSSPVRVTRSTDAVTDPPPPELIYADGVGVRPTFDSVTVGAAALDPDPPAGTWLYPEPPVIIYADGIGVQPTFDSITVGA